MHTSFHVTPAKVHDTEANDFQGCPILRNTLDFFYIVRFPFLIIKENQATNVVIQLSQEPNDDAESSWLLI
jgi:hypothetical protein